MQLVHALGWRILPVPQVEGKGSCFRLCRDRFWVADCLPGDLDRRLAEHALRVGDFTAAQIDACVMVDPSSHIACLRPAEAIDGQGHLPLCALCRDALGRMAGFPGQRDVKAAATALPHLTAMWLNAEGGQERRELSHHIRHPVAKILGWAEILQDDDSVSPEHARQLQVIYESARDLQRLLDNVASPL